MVSGIDRRMWIRPRVDKQNMMSGIDRRMLIRPLVCGGAGKSVKADLTKNVFLAWIDEG